MKKEPGESPALLFSKNDREQEAATKLVLLPEVTCGAPPSATRQTAKPHPSAALKHRLLSLVAIQTFFDSSIAAFTSSRGAERNRCAQAASLRFPASRRKHLLPRAASRPPSSASVKSLRAAEQKHAASWKAAPTHSPRRFCAILDLSFGPIVPCVLLPWPRTHSARHTSLRGLRSRKI